MRSMVISESCIMTFQSALHFYGLMCFSAPFYTFSINFEYEYDLLVMVEWFEYLIIYWNPGSDES